MRRKEREISRREELDEILRRALYLHVGVVDAEGPYVVPLNFGYAENTLYFHTAVEGRLLSALKQRPRVCFSVVVDAAPVAGENACAWSFRYRSIIGYGRAEILTDDAARRHGLDVVMAKFTPGPYEYAEKVLARTTVVAVGIESMTGKQLMR
jgi:nitroimidazol reductase NimA-like FMN-containing flavoprotein (pyridoxamine 5'-phosphate oxidase superfamily)